MADAPTNPATGESRPRTDWDIGKAMNGFFGGVATDEQEPDAEAAPDEGKAAEDGGTDEVEASGGEDAEPDEDEGTSEDPFTPLPLKVGGKEVVVESREEAIALAQKGMHYTQEMQKLRERETQLSSEHEQRSSELRQQMDQYKAALRTLSDVYGHVLDSEPDWNSPEMQKLKTEKPNDYLAIREQWDQLGAIRSELSRIEQEKQKESRKQWEGWLAEQKTALADKKPEWSDATRRQQDFAMIRDYATDVGITEQEIANLYDHRFWMILHDAARYRQAEAAGKTKREAVKSKVAEPGSGKGVNQGERRMRSTREHLKQTGDLRAAGDIFQDLMTRKR